MLEVKAVAQLAGVSQTAVRAQLASGALAGERVTVGKREVWRVHERAAAAYIAGHRGTAPAVPLDTGETAVPAPGDGSGGPEDGSAPPPASPGVTAQPGPPADPAPRALARDEMVAQLLEQNAELTHALVGLIRAHERLVVAVSGS